MQIKELHNPPILEALLEIRFNTNKNVTVEGLDTFAASLGATYPKKVAIDNTRFELTYGKDVGATHAFDVQPSGFKLTNANDNRIVIAAIDKFVISYLAPYESWPALLDTAKSLYAKYLQYAPQTEKIRLGLRYINKINMPANNDFKFESYIKTFPPIPKYEGIPDSISNFETVLVVPLSDIDCTSTVRQVLLNPENSGDEKSAFLPIILDIDVYRDVSTTMSDEEMWNTFEKMREKKNALFFGSLTDLAVQPYE